MDSAPQSREPNGPAGLRSLAKSCFRVLQFAFAPGTSRQWLLRPVQSGWFPVIRKPLGVRFQGRYEDKRTWNRLRQIIQKKILLLIKQQ